MDQQYLCKRCRFAECCCCDAHTIQRSSFRGWLACFSIDRAGVHNTSNKSITGQKNECTKNLAKNFNCRGDSGSFYLRRLWKFLFPIKLSALEWWDLLYVHPLPLFLVHVHRPFESFQAWETGNHFSRPAVDFILKERRRIGRGGHSTRSTRMWRTAVLPQQ